MVLANVRADLPRDYMLTSCNRKYVDMEFPGDYGKLLFCDGPASSPGPDGTTVMRVYFKAGIKSRQLAEKTGEIPSWEIWNNKPEAEAAIIEELKLWAKFGCMSRKRKLGATNVIDCREVHIVEAGASIEVRTKVVA